MTDTRHAAPDLVASFCAGGPVAAEIVGSDPAAAARLDRMLADARAAWPELRVDPAAFLRHVGERLSGVASDAPGDPLGSLHVSDLYLAFGCGAADPVAIAALERQFLPDAATAMARVVGRASDRDDVLQTLREKLLVGNAGGTPKIAEYSGRGPLAGWLRIAAVRTALSSVRKREPSAPQGGREALLEIPVSLGDPELDHIRERYKNDFKLAFQEALRALTPQERNVLRLNLVDGLNIEQIGTVYQVHRATVARWIARAREAVRDETRRLLAARLRLRGGEFDSLVGVLQSQLDVSIQRILTEER